MAKKKPPTYSKYQQWLDNGRPYWTGVALANAVAGYPVLKRFLNRAESPHNLSKLDGFLSEHYSMLEAEELSAGEKAQVLAQEVEPSAIPNSELGIRNGPKAYKAMGSKPRKVVANKVSEVGPEPVDEFSDTEFAAVPFQELPDHLKKGRMEAMRKRERAVDLHTRLGDGIEDENERSDVIGEIVECMDAVNLQWDIERAWKMDGIMPELPEDTLASLRKLDLNQLEDVIRNRLRPRRSRWRGACKLRDGDKLVEAKLNLHDAENTLALALQVYREKRSTHELHVSQVRERIAQRRTGKVDRALSRAKTRAATGPKELARGIMPSRRDRLDKIRTTLGTMSNTGLEPRDIRLRGHLQQVITWIEMGEHDTTRLAARISREQKVVERTAYHRIQEARYLAAPAVKKAAPVSKSKPLAKSLAKPAPKSVAKSRSKAKAKSPTTRRAAGTSPGGRTQRKAKRTR